MPNQTQIPQITKDQIDIEWAQTLDVAYCLRSSALLKAEQSAQE